jgi:threonine efflux protein
MGASASYWPGIFLAYATYAIAAISPGPAMMATMGTAMMSGRKAGIFVGLGIVLTSLFWGLVSIFGLSTLLLAYPSAVTMIRVFGCVYLLYLALKTFYAIYNDDIQTIKELTSIQMNSYWRFFQHGCALNITNPKAIMTWIAIISLSMQPDSPLWVIFAVVVGTMIFSFLFYTSIAIAFSSERMMVIYTKSWKLIDSFMAVFFIYAAIVLLRQ